MRVSYPWIWPAVWKMSRLGKAELYLLFTDPGNEFFILKHCSSLKSGSVALASWGSTSVSQFLWTMLAQFTKQGIFYVLQPCKLKRSPEALVEFDLRMPLLTWQILLTNPFY